MGDVLDLAPIKGRWAAATPGQWHWYDEVGEIPYEEAMGVPGNDGSLGILGLYVEIPDGDLEPVLEVDVMVAELGSPLEGTDRSVWRGLIHVSNTADLVCIAHAKADVAELIAEVERLRNLLPAG